MQTVIDKSSDTMTGSVASDIYKLYDESTGWVWACDVDTGQEMTTTDESGNAITTTVMQNVPIATNNVDIFYAQTGWPVTLKRMTSNKWAIVGLAKSKANTTIFVYVSFDLEYGTIVNRETKGTYIRPLTYDEIMLYGEYGATPYGVKGKFKASDDSFVCLIGV